MPRPNAVVYKPAVFDNLPDPPRPKTALKGNPPTPYF